MRTLFIAAVLLAAVPALHNAASAQWMAPSGGGALTLDDPFEDSEADIERSKDRMTSQRHDRKRSMDAKIKKAIVASVVRLLPEAERQKLRNMSARQRDDAVNKIVLALPDRVEKPKNYAIGEEGQWKGKIIKGPGDAEAALKPLPLPPALEAWAARVRNLME